MIAQLIESDHVAGREIFAIVGNATQPAWDARAGEMRGLATLWQAHGVMLERAVFPRVGQHADLTEGIGGLHRQVADIAADLAARAPGHDAEGRWLTDFERLKQLFDAQCLREDIELVPLLRDGVSADDLGEMTRQARALRQSKAA